MNAGWTNKRIGEVCDVVNGGTPKTGIADYWDGEHQWITPAEMGKLSTPYIEKTARTLTESGLSNSSARLLPPFSVILSSRAPIGYLVINTEPMATNQGCKGLVPSKAIDHKFLYHYLTSIVDLLNDLGTGATFKELSGSKLKEVSVPIPTLPEQQRIVSILDEAFEGIATVKANAEKNLQNAKELLESEVYLCFTQEKNSEKKPLVEVTDLVTDYVANGSFASLKENVVYRKEKGFAILLRLIDHSRNFKGDFVYVDKSAYDFLKKSRLYPGDIIISNVGARLGTVFRAPNIDMPMTLGPNSMLIRSNKLGDYLYAWLKSSYGQKEIKEIVSGAGQPKFNKTEFRNLLVPIPNDEGIRIEIIKKIDKLTEETQHLESIYQQKLSALDALKKSILHDAFRGAL